MIMGTIFIVISSILWGLVHSVLASHRFKRVLSKAFGSLVFNRFYRFAYNLFSVASLLPILLMLITFPDKTIYSIPSPWVYLTTLGQGLAAIALIAGVMQTGPMEFAGLAQLASGYEQVNSAELVVDGLYAYVRHPLYTAGLVFIWLSSDMSVNQFVLWIIFSFYIIIGAYFEEKKLLRDFGAQYQSYRAKTPMLIPFLSKKA